MTGRLRYHFDQAVISWSHPSGGKSAAGMPPSPLHMMSPSPMHDVTLPPPSYLHTQLVVYHPASVDPLEVQEQLSSMTKSYCVKSVGEAGCDGAEHPYVWAQRGGSILVEWRRGPVSQGMLACRLCATV